MITLTVNSNACQVEVSFDTGRILNPKTASSQFRGGIIMGIGMALTETEDSNPTR